MVMLMCAGWILRGRIAEKIRCSRGLPLGVNAVCRRMLCVQGWEEEALRESVYSHRFRYACMYVVRRLCENRCVEWFD